MSSRGCTPIHVVHHDGGDPVQLTEYPTGWSDVSPDGKFLYASNRGEANEIVVYSIDRNGKLTLAGRQSTEINTPRNFSIDPTGNYLLVGNQNANNIVIFRRDSKTGLLSDTGKRILVDKPVCLKFVAVD